MSAVHAAKINRIVTMTQNLHPESTLDRLFGRQRHTHPAVVFVDHLRIGSAEDQRRSVEALVIVFVVFVACRHLDRRLHLGLAEGDNVCVVSLFDLLNMSVHR